jgi:hypothetical protein
MVGESTAAVLIKLTWMKRLRNPKDQLETLAQRKVAVPDAPLYRRKQLGPSSHPQPLMEGTVIAVAGRPAVCYDPFWVAVGFINRKQ